MAMVDLETQIGIRQAEHVAGDALQQWQRRLSVNSDAARGPESEQAGAGAEEKPEEIAGDTQGGQYEFVGEGEAPQAGMLTVNSTQTAQMTVLWTLHGWPRLN